MKTESEVWSDTSICHRFNGLWKGWPLLIPFVLQARSLQSVGVTSINKLPMAWTEPENWSNPRHMLWGVRSGHHIGDAKKSASAEDATELTELEWPLDICCGCLEAEPS
jgi:hypothetical protein